MPHPPVQEAIIEFIYQGRFVKVTAVDPHTGIEATIVGDPQASKETLENLAIRKLNYILTKPANNS